MKLNETQLSALFQMDSLYGCMTAREYFLACRGELFNSFEFQGLVSTVEAYFTTEGWDQVMMSGVMLNNEGHNTAVFTKSWLFASVTHHVQNGKCDVHFAYSVDIGSKYPDTVKDVMVDLAKYNKDNTDSKFYILIKNDYGHTLRDFSVSIPKNINLELNYGEGFTDIHKTITNKMENEETGLFIFHGDSGCGKSTYIKKLAEEFPKKKFVYIPEFMVGSLNTPEIIKLFIENKDAIIVIEDAEKAIADRASGESSLVSILLNISDGILSDILKMPIILTYNTKTQNIDEALLRKGRLKYKHEFRRLSLDEVVKILKNNKTPKKEIDKLIECGKISKDMSIAEVFNLQDDIGEASVKKENIPVGFK